MARPSAEPVSRRERPAKAALTRAGIVAAAVEILRAEGLERVTMRRLAEKLDTGPASLYVYVRNADELHAAILDELLGSVDLAPAAASGAAGWRERLLVDGKEVARQAGATFLHRKFEVEIADGGKNVPVQVTTSASKQPRGIRCTVSVGGAPIYDEVKWPARWYVAISAFAVAAVFGVAAVVLRTFGH